MTSTKLSILVVEDQMELAQNIAEYLEPKGHILDFATDGKQAIELALSNNYDLIVLDIMLPKIDGIEVCKHLRTHANQHIPVLMLTARDTLQDKLTGFEVGADDYLTKPFALQELEVRCLSLSRRHILQTSHVIEIGPLQINRQTQEVVRDNQRLDLSAMNYKILLILAEAYPQVVTRSRLSQKLWADEPTDSDALRSHIYQLRQVLDKPFKHDMLKTIHKVGFSLVES